MSLDQRSEQPSQPLVPTHLPNPLSWVLENWQKIALAGLVASGGGIGYFIGKGKSPESSSPAPISAPQPKQEPPVNIAPSSPKLSEVQPFVPSTPQIAPSRSISKPDEKPLAIQAQEAAIDYWLRTFSRTQGRNRDSSDNNGYLQMRINQIGQVDGRPITGADIVANRVSEENNFLETVWTQKMYLTDVVSSNGNRVGLVGVGYGEAEIKNMRTTPPLAETISNADRANGLSWKGQSSLEYIIRNRGRISYDNQDPKYILYSLSMPYGQWKDEHQTLKIIRHNDTWRIILPTYKGVESPINIITNLSSYLDSGMNFSEITNCRPPIGCNMPQ